jgi:SRSO17 transposase
MLESVTEDDIAGWAQDVQAWTDDLGFLFNRPEPKRTFSLFIKGLLSNAPKKNAWGLAEQLGYRSPDALQHLMSRASWDADVLRDQVRSRVVDGLGDAGAVLVVDDTQVQKWGDKSVGVAPQYCGVTGDTRNVQTMVMLTYASVHGHAYIDRELYLPESWTSDPARLKAAKVPDERVFLTKPQLAGQMLDRSMEAGVPFAAVVFDSGYGKDEALRTHLSSRDLAYAAEVPKSLPVFDDAGRRTRADRIHRLLPGTAWQLCSQGPGEKGERTYDYAMVPVEPVREAAAENFDFTLLIRKTKLKTVKKGTSVYEFAYFLVHAPYGTSLKQMVAWTGSRWSIEDDNKAAKNEFGLEDYQVRTWTSWHRYVTSSMLAHAFIAVKRAELGKDQNPETEAVAG